MFSLGQRNRLRGTSRLVIEAVTAVVDTVEAMQHVIGGGPEALGRPFERLTRIVTRPVYATIRGTTRAIGSGIDVALAGLAPLLGGLGQQLDFSMALAVVNGVLGDYLAESGNPLATEMRLRHDGRPLELERRALREQFPGATRKLLVLVHGSCRHDLQWGGRGRDALGAIAEELGYTPIHLLYNSGLHIAANGRTFASLLEQLVTAWPVPVDDVTIVGHSMGGLVARSACHAAEQDRRRWRQRLRRLICIASPHHGAPLERGGHWFHLLLEVSRYSAPLARLGRMRSAGVTDLRYGNVLDEHVAVRGRFAAGGDPRRELKLPAGVRCYAVAATRTLRPGGKLASDGLVPVESALGLHRNPKLTLAFDETWIGFGMGHVELLGRAEVGAVLRTWLAS